MKIILYEKINSLLFYRNKEHPINLYLFYSIYLSIIIQNKNVLSVLVYIYLVIEYCLKCIFYKLIDMNKYFIVYFYYYYK